MRRVLSLRRTAHIAVALLTLLSLGLIVRSTRVVWQNYCDASTGGAANPATCLESLQDLVPLAVALGFTVIGLGVWFTSRRRLSPIFFLLVSAVLAAGLATGWPDPDDVSIRLFYLLLAWLAPLTFQFHVGLLDRPLRPTEKLILGVLYLLAAAASIPLVYQAGTPVSQAEWFPSWRVLIRIGLAASAIAAWMRLLREYRHRASLPIRRHIRLVVFGTLLGFAPLVLLSLLPETLALPVHVSYVVTFPWLLLAPLAYAYSLFRYRMARAELALNRSAVYYLLVVSLLTLYLLAAALLSSRTARAASISPPVNAILTVALVLLFVPLRRGIERLINWVLYGGEINYVEMVQRLAEALSLTLDRATLRRLLLEEWAAAMHLSRCLVFLRDDAQTLLYLGGTGVEGINHLSLRAEGALAAYLEAVDEPVPDEQVRQAILGRTLDPQEQALLRVEGIAYWLPLVSAHNLQGLLLAGPRMGVDFFTPEDERILDTVAHQAGIAAHNVRLMHELHASREELALAHRELLVGREQERQQLAHELHDGAVQQLLGISYQLVDDKVPALRREILDVVGQLRGVIGELRPAGLKELGLPAALEGFTARLRREGSLGTLDIELKLDPDLAALPEDIAICLFRAAQEALRNTLKHAHAHKLGIHLRRCNEHVELELRDDGCGFRVPPRLSEFAASGHYGLVSMAERVAALGGQMDVRSELDAGTQVVVQVPLKRMEEENANQVASAARG